MTDLAGKKRPANDADLGLRCLGYWTDNGATYYYHYDTALGYAGTLEKLAEHYRRTGVPIRYLQLDSWWYYKSLTDPNGGPLQSKRPELPEGEWNRYGGLLKYEAHPAVLPDGLAGFAAKVQLPLITHNRWIDLASPYRRDYHISGYAAVDPRWWDDIMGSLRAAGVVGYEQDWLNVIYLHSPELMHTPGVGEAFTDNMARAAREKGLTIQYCMPLPRFYLQASRYDNVTTARASRDRFQRAFWDPFLYTSRLATSVGLWPWTDVFMSTETDNALIAILSAGMYGIGDPIGGEAAINLSRAARADGVLVKPDLPLLPADEMYLAEANGYKPPMVAWTRTDHPAQRTAYLFLYVRGTEAEEASFKPESLGFAGDVMVFNRATGTAWREPASQLFLSELLPGGYAYFEIAPVRPGGLVFFGDQGKFVSNGRQRISDLTARARGVTATVRFAASEKSVTLFGFSRGAPLVRAQRGRIGEVAYHAGNGRYEFAVFPSDETSLEQPGGEKIRQAVVEIESAPAKR